MKLKSEYTFDWSEDEFDDLMCVTPSSSGPVLIHRVDYVAGAGLTLRLNVRQAQAMACRILALFPMREEKDHDIEEVVATD